MNKFVYNGKITVKTQLTKFIFALAFVSVTFVAMTFVDSIGNISNDEGVITTILRAILASVGILELNILSSVWSTLFLGLAVIVAGAAVYFALPLIFKSAYTKLINKSLIKKYIIDIVVAIILVAIVGVIFFAVIVGGNSIFDAVGTEGAPSAYDCLIETVWAWFVVAVTVAVLIFIVATAAYAIIKLYTSVHRIVKEDISSKEEEDPNAKISIFPTLEESDKKLDTYDANQVYPEAPSLSVISEKFQAYIATVHKIYFDIDLVRSYIAGLATSKVVLLEGLSGTGKSTLPRRFMEFIGGNSEFIPVQSTWKDRADLIGYYNDFTNNFKETRFLKTLYENNYTTDKISTIVLDEVNLSRIEYYFADFISAMEYPVDMRYVELMQPIKGRKMPKLLEDGKIHINENTFFVGTANKDESTYTITERVYDRAIVINFEEKHFPIETENVTEPIKISYNQFEKLVNDAKANENGKLTDDEMAKFEELYNFINDNFDVQVGDRIFAQLDTFTSVFAACGGNKYRALDVMFANKFVRKLNNIFDDSMGDSLDKLVALIDNNFGKDNFVESVKQIALIKKKLY